MAFPIEDELTGIIAQWLYVICQEYAPDMPPWSEITLKAQERWGDKATEIIEKINSFHRGEQPKEASR